MKMRILFVALLVANPLAAAESPLPDAANTDARLFPPSTVVYAELSNPVEMASTIFDHPLRERIEALPPYKMAIQTPPYRKCLLARTMVEGQLKMPWREAIETLLADRVSFAVDANTHGGVVVIHGKDAESMKLFHQKLLEFAKLGDNRDNLQQGEYRGVEAYKLKEVAVAVQEDRLLVTNNRELGKQVIDRLIA